MPKPSFLHQNIISAKAKHASYNTSIAISNRSVTLPPMREMATDPDTVKERLPNSVIAKPSDLMAEEKSTMIEADLLTALRDSRQQGDSSEDIDNDPVLRPRKLNDVAVTVGKIDGKLDKAVK
ncbi:hypothetical protein ACHAPT_008595 [Fusarium lateritium]